MGAILNNNKDQYSGDGLGRKLRQLADQPLTDTIDDNWTVPLESSIPWIVSLNPETMRPPIPSDLPPSTEATYSTTTKRPPIPGSSIDPTTQADSSTTILNKPTTSWTTSASTTASPTAAGGALNMTYILVGVGAGIVVLLAILLLVWKFANQRSDVIYSRSRHSAPGSSIASAGSVRTKRSAVGKSTTGGGSTTGATSSTVGRRGKSKIEPTGSKASSSLGSMATSGTVPKNSVSKQLSPMKTVRSPASPRSPAIKSKASLKLVQSKRSSPNSPKASPTNTKK